MGKYVGYFLSIYSLVIFLVAPLPAYAVACGINIDPANKAGYPKPSSLASGSWVRLEYKDCSGKQVKSESIDSYRKVLSNYKNAGIKTLVILDYLTYPNANNQKDAFAARATYINKQLGSLVDAYEIWNEPDIGQGGNLSPSQFGEILDAVVPKLEGKTVVLGGLASGQAEYLRKTLSSIKPETLQNISAIGVHPYAKSVYGFPGGMTGDMGTLIYQYKAVSRGKPIWITEIGINTTDGNQLSGYLDRVFAAGFGDPTFWFAWSDGMVDKFGIVDKNQNPKANFTNYFSACGAVAPTGKQQTFDPITPAGGQGCGISSGSGSNLAEKFNSSLSPSNFHLSPLTGLYPDPGRRDYARIRADLVEQGYQAYCAIPEQQIEGSIGPKEIVKLFLSGGGDEELKLKPILTLDYSLAKTPLFRDSKRKFTLKSDLEEYWAYQESGNSDYSQNELNSAPIESLLSESQRCGEGVKNLLAQDNMCSLLTTPNACSLYAFPIAKTRHTIKSLLEKYRSIGGNKNNIRDTCKDLEKNTDESKRQLFTDLTQVPLTIERGYRFAFLVLSLKEKKPDPNQLFSFFAHTSKPRDEVLVVAFKIPDVITNKPSANSISGSNSKAYPYFSDGSMLAKNSLLSTNQQVKEKNAEAEEKTNLSNAITTVINQNSSNPIYCLDGQPPDGTGSVACNDQLVKALTDIVNAQNQINSEQLNCVGPEAIDKSYSINEPAAAKLQSPRSVFPPEMGGEIVRQLFLQLGSTNTDTVLRKFISTFRINKQTTSGGAVLSDSTSLKSYLVYPVGYKLEEIENVLANSFMTKTQISALETDPNNNKRFEMFGGTTKLTENTGSIRVFNPKKCKNSPVGDCYSSIDAIVNLGVLKPIQFLGAKLGYYLRAVQRTLAKQVSGVQTYLASCKTTEEFLLDRCGGVGKVQPQQSLSYCGMNELAISNNSTSLFKICKTGVPPENCQAIDQGNNAYFLDSSSNHSLQLAARILDGGTLLTTGSVVTMNPGQNLTEAGSMSRCGSGPKNITVGQIWYLPPDVPLEEVTTPKAWDERGSKLVPITGTDIWTNVIFNLQVKPGYYMIPSYTFGCLSRGIVWIGKDGQNTKDAFANSIGSAIIPVGVTTKGRNSYCAKATFNSNMPGGPDGRDSFLMTDSFGCKVNEPGYDIMLNTSCGGLNGADNLQLWYDLLKPDGKPTVAKLPGLDMYEKIFGLKFELPNLKRDEVMSCDNLFPNTIREVSCDTVNNSDVGSVANFGKDIAFDIEYWNGATVTFRPPSQTIWDSVNSAAKDFACDPLLVLATAHSESPDYNNNTVSGAGAAGVWQFTPGAWGIWSTPYNPNADACSNHEPGSFTQAYIRSSGLDFSSPTNIAAAANSACRLLLWTGAQKYPDNENAFVNAFSIQGENSYGQIWNSHTQQAKYVFRLWQSLREKLGKDPVQQPANYPNLTCLQ